MVQNQRISSFCIVLLVLLLCVVNRAEPMPQNNPEIRRLVEIKTVDEKGVVKARVVAVYETTRDSEGQKTSSESDGESKRLQDDDEDSKEISSGDSETYGESYNVAHDDPNSANESESSGSPSRGSDSSVNTTSKPADSKSSTVQPTTSQINASTTSPTTARLTSTNTTSVPQTTRPMTTIGTKVTVTTGKQNVTTLSTLSPSTKDTRKNLTTISPKVTEVRTTAPATTSSVPTTTSAPTTTTTVPTTSAAPKPTKITRTTESNVTVGTPFEASTTARSNFTDQGITGNKTVTTKASVTTSKDPDVKGQEGPETKARRKTLFGFVTLEILIALLAGALFSVLLVAFLVYRLKKRNEGSYELSETIALRPKEIDEMGKKKEVFV